MAKNPPKGSPRPKAAKKSGIYLTDEKVGTTPAQDRAEVNKLREQEKTRYSPDKGRERLI